MFSTDNLDNQSKFQIFTLQAAILLMLVHHRGAPTWRSVNFCETLRRVSAMWEKVQSLSLEKYLLYLIPMLNIFLDAIHWMFFDLFIFMTAFFSLIYPIKSQQWFGKYSKKIVNSDF